jgi:hypothetical protein
MSLRQTILKEHSKRNCDQIVSWIGASQARFDQLISLLDDTDPVVPQRTSWPLSFAGEKHPKLIARHVDRLFDKMDEPDVHNGIRRNIMRLFQFVELEEKYHGRLMDTCFRFIGDLQEKVAVKACAFTVLCNLAKHYPDIIPEIKLVVDEQSPHMTASFKARVKQFLRQLNRPAGKRRTSRASE